MVKVNAMRVGAWGVVVALHGLVGGCFGAPEPDGSNEAAAGATAEAVAALTSEGPRYLPYGVPVPVGAVVTALPEPYDPEKHGPPTTDAFPQQNEASTPDAVSDASHRRGRWKTESDPPPGTGDRGLWISAGIGIYAINDLEANLFISGPTPTQTITMYTPTHQSAGGSCVETVRRHRRASGSPSTSHHHGFWDWCRATPGWGLLEVTSTTWQNKYARIISGGPGTLEYITQVWRSTATCWDGLLYNYSTGTWDSKLVSCGTTQTGFGNTGWTMWESYGMFELGLCPDLPDIHARNILTLVAGNWTGLTSSNSSALNPTSCFTVGWSDYTWHTHGSNSYWEAHTP